MHLEAAQGIGAVVIIVALAMNESKPKPVVGPYPVIQINLPSDPSPSGGNHKSSPATVQTIFGIATILCWQYSGGR